jgi:hypothetical protein
VQFCARGIGEHFQNVHFFIDILFIEYVGFGLFPLRLPFAFYGFHIHTTKNLRISAFSVRKVSVKKILFYYYNVFLSASQAENGSLWKGKSEKE